MMLRRKWPVDGRQLVIVKPINKDRQVDGDSQSVQGIQPHAMGSFIVWHSRGYRGGTAGGCGGIRAHLLVPFSSVPTENFLYSVNWCKLRQCCRGVSTSTIARVGNQYTGLESAKGRGAKSISECSDFSPTSCNVSSMPASILAMAPDCGSIHAVPASSSGYSRPRSARAAGDFMP